MWCAEKPEFVAQDVQAKLVDIFRRHPLNALRWVTPSKSAPTSNDYCLTPFGLLELRLDLGWTAFRNGEPLVHPACRLWHGESGVWPALFTDYDAARAAALMNCFDGWGMVFSFFEPIDSKFAGLFWWLPPGARLKDDSLVTEARREVIASDLEDGYEFGGSEQLRRLIEPWGLPADPDMVQACSKAREAWRLPAPTWTRRVQGWYELKTPYGVLACRRERGWVIERDSAALEYWWLSGKPKVVCDSLQDAQTMALRFAHVRDDPGHVYDYRPPGQAFLDALTQDEYCAVRALWHKQERGGNTIGHIC
jgi:hypothetical protein